MQVPVGLQGKIVQKRPRMDRIEQRRARWGIESRYHDAFGRLHEVEPEALTRLLAALSRGERAGAAAASRNTRRPFRPRSVRVIAGLARHASHLDNRRRAHRRARQRQGTCHSPAKRSAGRQLHAATQIWRTASENSHTAGRTGARLSGRRSTRAIWGLAVQLYGVRSQRNWGHGDFTDLAALIDIAADHGAARDRAQSAACAVRRPCGGCQPLFAQQPALSQHALHRCRGRSRISRSRCRGSER